MRLADGRWTYRFDKALRSPETPLPRPDPELAWAWLPKISSPTLLIRGAESDVLATETAARMLDLLPTCTLVEIPDSGHSLGVDQPTAFHAAITTFLEDETPAETKRS